MPLDLGGGDLQSTFGRQAHGKLIEASAGRAEKQPTVQRSVGLDRIAEFVHVGIGVLDLRARRRFRCRIGGRRKRGLICGHFSLGAISHPKSPCNRALSVAPSSRRMLCRWQIIKQGSLCAFPLFHPVATLPTSTTNTRLSTAFALFPRRGSPSSITPYCSGTFRNWQDPERRRIAGAKFG